MPETSVDAVGSTGEAVEEFESDNAVVGGFNVLSAREVALSAELLDGVDLGGVDVQRREGVVGQGNGVEPLAIMVFKLD